MNPVQALREAITDAIHDETGLVDLHYNEAQALLQYIVELESKIYQVKTEAASILLKPMMKTELRVAIDRVLKKL